MEEKKSIYEETGMSREELFAFVDHSALESEKITAPRYSYWKSVWRTFFKNKFTVGVAVLLIFIIAFALIQPMLSGYSPIVTPNINNAETKTWNPRIAVKMYAVLIANEFGMEKNECNSILSPSVCSLKVKLFFLSFFV